MSFFIRILRLISLISYSVLFVSDIKFKSTGFPPALVEEIANEINKSEIDDPLFVAVLNGSFLFAADIMRKINLCW